MKMYDLKPVNGEKSFYGKAVVEIAADGSETLYSYGTAIITKTAAGQLVKLWDGWTATTGRHIKAFCGLNKAGFAALPYSGPAYDPAGRTLTAAESYRAMMGRRAIG